MPPQKPHFGALKPDKYFATIHQTGEAADRVFYEAYDPEFLMKKAILLYGVYRNAPSFREGSRAWSRGVEIEEADLLSLLATELHCASFHQAETTLSLLLAEYQSRPDWVYLTSYGNAEMKNAAKRIVAKEYSELTGGIHSTAEEFIKAAVFANIDLSGASSQWQASISDLIAFLSLVAEHFVNGPEYNAYKHGLRVVSGSSALALGSQGAAPSFVMHLKHMMEYLSLYEDAEGYGAQRITKEISPDYSFELVGAMGYVLSVTKQMRLARIYGRLPENEVTLPHIDIEKIAALRPMTSYAFPY